MADTLGLPRQTTITKGTCTQWKEWIQDRTDSTRFNKPTTYFPTTHRHTVQEHTCTHAHRVHPLPNIPQTYSIKQHNTHKDVYIQCMCTSTHRSTSLLHSCIMKRIEWPCLIWGKVAGMISTNLRPQGEYFSHRNFEKMILLQYLPSNCCINYFSSSAETNHLGLIQKSVLG